MIIEKFFRLPAFWTAQGIRFSFFERLIGMPGRAKWVLAGKVASANPEKEGRPSASRKDGAHT